MSALKGTDEEPLFTELASVPGTTDVEPRHVQCENGTRSKCHTIRVFSLAENSAQ